MAAVTAARVFGLASAQGSLHRGEVVEELEVVARERLGRRRVIAQGRPHVSDVVVAAANPHLRGERVRAVLLVRRTEEPVECSARHVRRAHTLRGVEQKDLVRAHRRDPVELGPGRIVGAEELHVDVRERAVLDA